MLLAVPPMERGAREAVQRWNDVEFVEMLESIDERGGLPLPHDGTLNGITLDCRRLPRLDAAQWRFAHACMRKELDRGWVHRYASHDDVPWDSYAVNPWFLTAKTHLGRQLKGADGNLKWRWIDNLSFAHANVGSINEHAPLNWAGGWFDGVDFASAEIMRTKTTYGDVEVAKVDEDSAYRCLCYSADARRFMGRWVLDPTKPIPQHVLNGEQPRADDCCLLFSNRLCFGAGWSALHYHRFGRALNALFLWKDHPGLTDFYVPSAQLSCARWVDDSLIIAGPGWGAAAKARFFALLARYGAQYSVTKDEDEGAIVSSTQPGTAARRIFLGIELDLHDERMRVPPERVDDCVARLQRAIASRSVRRSEFESLVGVLGHYVKCIPFAKLFLRRAWTALACSHGRWVRLNRGIRVDLQWFASALSASSGETLCLDAAWTEAAELGLYTDSSLDGFGGIFVTDHRAEYFHGRWDEYGVDASMLNINQLELACLGLALHHWRTALARRRVIMRCDNTTACAALNNQYCRDPAMLVVLRQLYLAQAEHSFVARASYINTHDNIAADALSRNDLARCFNYARNVLGVTEFNRVEPSLNVGTLLQRMVAAHTNSTAHTPPPPPPTCARLSPPVAI